MKQLFSNFFRISISTSVIFCLFGLLLFFNPESFIVAISIILGIIAIVYGVFEIVLYTKNKDVNQSDLMVGIVALAGGIILIIRTDILATIIPIIIGISLIILGVKKIQLAFDFKKNNINNWLYMFIMALITFGCGAILVINPIKGAFVATQVVGIIIIIYSVIDIVDSLMFKKSVEEVVKVIDAE